MRQDPSVLAGLVVISVAGCQAQVEEDAAQVSQALQGAYNPPGLCASTPKLDLRIRQVANQSNHLKYRAQILNHGSTAIALSDLKLKFWLSDTASSLVVDNFYGGNVFTGSNGWGFNGTQLTSSATELPFVCTDPQRRANWRLEVGTADARLLPANGGKWVDLNFGVHRSDWSAFDDVSDDYSQTPSYQGGGISDKTFNPNDPSSVYGNDGHFALYYQGHLVKEWSGPASEDLDTAEEPSCFRSCVPEGNGHYPIDPNDQLDSTLAKIADVPSFANYCISTQCIPMRQTAAGAEVIAIVETSGNIDGVRGLLTQVVYELPQISTIAGYVPVSALAQLRTHPDVVSAKHDVFVRPAMDTSRVAEHADQVEATFHMSGEGALVGIVDSGIDWRHRDFQQPQGRTTVYAIWDQLLTAQGAEKAPDALWGHNFTEGAVYTSADINAAIAQGHNTSLVRSLDGADGHGTSCASAAAGTGAATGYRGIAPGADLFVVHAADGWARHIAGTQLVFDEAKRLGRPVVVNHSIGGNYYSHSDADWVVKNMVAVLDSYEQGVIVTAAGNEGNKGTHASGTIGTNASETVTLTMEYGAGTDVQGFVLDGWFEPYDLDNDGNKIPYTFSGLRLRADAYQGGQGELLPDGRQLFEDANDGPVSRTDGSFSANVRGEVQRELLKRAYFEIQVDITSLPPVPPGATSNTIVWNLTIDTEPYTLESDPNTVLQGTGGDYDIWLTTMGERHTRFTGVTGEGGVTEASSVMATSCSSKYVVVGAYDESTTLVADASGRGPMFNYNTGDEEDVIDLVAAGYDGGEDQGGIHLAKSDGSDSASSHGSSVHSGSSFAAPQVAGAVALMQQKNSKLTAAEIDGLLHQSADTSGLSGLPDHAYGYGRLDALAAVQAVPTKAIEVADNVIPINDTVGGWHRYAELAMDLEGNAFIAWTADTSNNSYDDYAAFYKKLGPDGSSLIGETMVAAPHGGLFRPQVAVNSKGEAVVAWTAHLEPEEACLGQVQANLYDANGGLLTASPILASPGLSYNSVKDVVFLDDDHLMFTWVDVYCEIPNPGDNAPDVQPGPAWLRVYDLSASTWMTDSVEISAYWSHSPRVASANGRTVIVWSEDHDNDGDTDIVMADYTGLLGPLSAATVISADPSSGSGEIQRSPRVAINQRGKVGISYLAYNQGAGDTFSVHLQSYDANGLPIDNWNSQGTYRSSDVSVKLNGDVVLVYMNRKDTPDLLDEILAKRFNNDGTVNDVTIATMTRDDLYVPPGMCVDLRGGGSGFVVWPEYTASLDGSNVHAKVVDF